MKKLLIICCALALNLHAETLYLVKGGELTAHAVKKGSSWKGADGVVLGGGIGQLLALDRSVDASNFEVVAVLSLEKLGHTAAGMTFGSEYFGFDGANNTFFTEGGCFKKAFIEGADELIKQGQVFTFKAVARNGQITFSIDEKEITSQPYTAKQVFGLALRPHRSEMAIRDFKVTGSFAKFEKLPHLFVCGKEGYKSYRIPAITRTTKGTLLAFCEGRVHGAGDHGDIDLVMKRSTDNGKSWSDLEVVFDNDDHVVGNPCPIVDQKSGRVFLISCTSSVSEHALMQGKGRREIFIQHSDDDGKSWSKPRDISKGIYPKDWRWYATGPCSGIQILLGKYRGRLVVPANHSVFADGKNTYRAHSLYSDDFGKTWKLGEVSAPGGNESQIAEAGTDLLYQTIRMQSHSKGMRGTRYSRNGGKNWTDLEHDKTLNDPRCQGSVIRDYSEPSRLIFSNPATGGRNGMTIHVSEDGGKTWPYSKLILKTSSAYSDLVITADDQVGILFEGGHRAYAAEGIIFQRFSKDELLVHETTL